MVLVDTDCYTYDNGSSGVISSPNYSGNYGIR